MLQKLRKAMNFNKQIGNTIKYFRKKQGITLEKLAYESDFSKGGLSEIERGMREIRISSLKKLCVRLNINISEFFEYLEEHN